MKIYVDACVYLDYLEDRKDKMRPLGEFAFQVFKRAFSCEFKIIFSDWLLKELSKFADESFIDEFTFHLKELNKLVFVKLDKRDVERAKKLSSEGFPLCDSLHYVLAEKSGAWAIITRNVKDFPMDRRLKVLLPEQL